MKPVPNASKITCTYTSRTRGPTHVYCYNHNAAHTHRDRRLGRRAREKRKEKREENEKRSEKAGDVSVLLRFAIFLNNSINFPFTVPPSPANEERSCAARGTVIHSHTHTSGGVTGFAGGGT